MELKLNIEYNELLMLIKQLPAAKIAQLKSDLNSTFKDKSSGNESSEFQNFLLTAPVMTDNEYEQFLENRKQFNEWRTA
jgi:hypothetical protein